MADAFEATRERVFALYEAHRFAEALQIAREARPSEPEHRWRLDFWIACLSCRLGRPREALATLQATIRGGGWVNPDRLSRDPDLEPLRGTAAFARVLAACEARRAAAQAALRPEVWVLPPDAAGPPETSAPPPPLVLALHMAGSSARAAEVHWRAVTETGALLVLPRGPRVVGPGEYAWSDAPEAELATLLESARQDAPFDPERVVLAGASQGAAAAVRMALRRDPLPCRGFVAVAGAPTDAPLPGDLRAAAEAGLRGVFLTGDRDPARPRIERAHAQLERAGLEVHLEVAPDTGHAYPRDFRERVGRAVAFVLGA